MSKINDLEQLNVRVEPKIAEAFKDYCKDTGINYTRCMERFMDFLQGEKAKELLPGREVEIDTFNHYLEGIKKIYMNSLDLFKDTDSRIHAEYEKKLSGKDMTIDDLREKIASKETIIQQVEQEKKETLKQKQLVEEKLESVLRELELTKQSLKLTTDKLALFKSLQSMLDEQKADEQEKKM